MSDTLFVLHPPGYAEERSYIFRVILEEFLGLGYECLETPGNTVQIRLAHAPEGGVLTWSDVLLQTAPEDWLTTASLPRALLPAWNASRDLPEARLAEGRIPIIYGSPVAGGNWFTQEGRAVRLGADIAGSVFFMLTRYEEAVLPD
ncbi:MAG: MarR family transcriptional regulator, partial [Thermoleophilia bacterium]|nr:MarR family transcriptional regulator [Thermoleophilia bacterium]